MKLCKQSAVDTGIVQVRRKRLAAETSSASRDFTIPKGLVRDIDGLAEAEGPERGRVIYWTADRPIAPAGQDRDDAFRSQHREKMEAVGQLAGGLAHDLGNVLAAIRLNLGAIQQRPLNATTKTIIDNAIAAADDGQRVIRSLLSLCRQDAPRIEPFDATSGLSRIALLMRHSFDARLRIVLTIARDIWPILGDEGQLELAILNLGVNARDAMPDGGKLRITAANTEGPAIARGVVGNFVAITVADTGEGMSREVAAKAFEPFFTTKGPDKGTGLGLSQVHRFAKDCGGMVTLDSALGRGTRVTLYLPARPGGPLRP